MLLMPKLNASSSLRLASRVPSGGCNTGWIVYYAGCIYGKMILTELSVVSRSLIRSAKIKSRLAYSVPLINSV